MKSIYKRLLFLGLGLSLVALAGLQDIKEQELEGNIDGDQSDGGQPDGGQPDPEDRKPIPFPTASPSDGTAQFRSQPVFIPATTVTFSGRLVRNGQLFALRETAGALYMLDGIGRILPLEGKNVRVTGKLDITRTLLHVDEIESFVA